jgi:hypothetical protein
MNIKEYVRRKRVGFLTNSTSNELLNLSSGLFEIIIDKLIVINGKDGFYGYEMFASVLTDIILHNSYDYLVYFDDDFFLSDPEEFISTLQYFIDNDYTFAGMPDGGVVSHRFHNPISINTFFVIFNLKFIKQVFKKNKVHRSYYSKDLDKFIPRHLLKKKENIKTLNYERFKSFIDEGFEPFSVSLDNFEPYYRIFFYLLRNGARPLYLGADDADETDDKGWCTKLYGINGKAMGYHCWFSRNFETTHKERIMKIYEYVNNSGNSKRDGVKRSIVFKTKSYEKNWGCFFKKYLSQRYIPHFIVTDF